MATREVTGASEDGIAFDLPFSEETVTDLLLADLKRRLGPGVEIWKSPKAVEARNGADWVWWIGGRAGWFGMQVQAKRMDHRRQDYPYLQHTIGKTGLAQSEVLIRTASAEKLFPAYAFYNAFGTTPPAPTLRWNCACQGYLQRHLGCVLASAVAVVKHRNYTRFSVNDAAAIGLPLHCLDCDLSLGPTPMSAPERARNWAVRLRNFHRDLDSDDDRDVPPIRASLPDEYMRLLAPRSAPGLGRVREPAEIGDPGFDHLAGVLFITDQWTGL